jgi:capsular exopolysaccharide synthesis family protein
LAEAQQTAQLQMSQDSIALLADQEVTSSPAIQALDARIKEIEFRVDKLKASSVGERNPIYQQQISEKAILESKREDMKKQILETSKQRIAGQGVEERKKSVSEFADKVKTLKDRRASLESQIKEFISMMKLTGSGGAELQFAEADLLEWQKTRGQIHDRSVALATERESLEPIRELQRSTPPKLPVESLPLKQLLFANAIGLALPLLIAFGLELRSHRIDSAMSLEKQSEMLVLGEISALPYSADPGSKRAEKALRLYEESIDSLTMSLVLSPNLKQARTLAVTSALAAEGKTTVACQLALSIARSTGKVVLLIDGDMRAPDVHHVFDRKMNSGLAGFLSGENDLSEVIDRDWSSQVHILHAGYLKGSPHRLLSQGAIDRLIEKAKESYDYVIIDTPPILPASESLIYARSVDYCLVCALRDRSRVEQLMQAVNKLEAAGANVAGAVLSGVPFREYSKYYGDYAYGNWDRSQS